MSTPPGSPISSRTRSQAALSNSPITKAIGAMASEVADMAGQTIDLVKDTRRSSLPTPTFDGMTDVEDFITQFERVATFMHWAEDEKLIRFQMAIIGAAKKGLTANSYEGICAQLRSRYQLSENGSVALLKSLKWKAGDSVHEFAAYVRRLVTAAFPELNDKQKEQRAIKELTNALPPSCHTLAWELRNRTPNTYKQVIDLIQDFNELNVKPMINRVETDEMSSLRKEVSNQGALIEQLIASQTELQKQLTTALAQNKPRRNNKGSILCYRCRKEGHIAKNCSESRPQGQSENDNVQ